MDWLHLKGVENIQWLQNTFEGHTELMLFLSHMGDPRNAFLVYFPLSFFISTSVGVQVMWVASVSEWLNAILKWVLHGQRPYWWVHETQLYDKAPDLQQFRLTCETGPGSPSGHAMVTAAVLYVMMTSLIRHIRSQPHVFSTNKVFLSRWLWISFLAVMATVSLSRVYIATHFPHQVVAGVLTGILIAMACEKFPTTKVSLTGYVLVTTILLVSGPFLYWVFGVFGFDLQWSVDLAKRWCAKKEWVYLDTTPFFALTRDASALMGLGAGLYLTRYAGLKTPLPPTSIPYKIMAITLSLLITRGLKYVKIPQDVMVIFYTLAYIRNFIFPLVIVVIIPKLLRLILVTEQSDKKAR